MDDKKFTIKSNKNELKININKVKTKPCCSVVGIKLCKRKYVIVQQNSTEKKFIMWSWIIIIKSFQIFFFIW